MAELKKYRCGVCQKNYDNPEALRNEVALMNGEFHFTAFDVCDECAKELGSKIKEMGAELVVNRSISHEAITV